MWIITERILAACQEIARYYLNQGVTYPGAWYLVGCLRRRRGDSTGAERAYSRAIHEADRSKNRIMFKVRQQWQFELERTLHEAGRPRVDDPIFACRALPAPASRVSDAARRVAPGSYRTRWSFRGLRITGFLDPRYTTGRKIRLSLNGTLLRELSVAKAPLIPPYFQITIQRPAIASFPPSSQLVLESADGKTLLCQGCSVTHLHVPHGTGGAGRRLPEIDKKGFLIMADVDLAKRQAEFLEIYRAARETFAREFGKPLFLLYGTLLGFYRS